MKTTPAKRIPRFKYFTDRANHAVVAWDLRTFTNIRYCYTEDGVHEGVTFMSYSWWNDGNDYSKPLTRKQFRHFLKTGEYPA